MDLEYEEVDIIRALRNCKRNPNNKTLTNILLGVIDDTIENYKNEEQYQ